MFSWIVIGICSLLLLYIARHIINESGLNIEIRLYVHQMLQSLAAQFRR